MKRLLIISPHFPPTDAPDMHRVRMNAAHYAAHGWAPTVLSVTPETADRAMEPRLAESACEGLDLRRVAAPTGGLAKRLGLRAIGLRAWGALARGGDRAIAAAEAEGRPFDLAFFSTTASPVMALGPRWLKRFGLPFVLDYQDPWSARTAATRALRRRGLKHRAMRALHWTLERRTAPKAAGLIAVSPAYLETLTAAYPSLAARPKAAIPFGWSRADRALARARGAPWPALRDQAADGAPTLLCAGRLGAPFEDSLDALFRLMRQAPEASPLGRLCAAFLGTGYQRRGNMATATPLAAASGLSDRVVEAPDRLPLLDALATLEAADALLVLGSNDPTYQPSRLHQALSFDKPVFIVAPAASRLGALGRELAATSPGVVFAPTETGAADPTGINEALIRAFALREADYAPRRAAQAAFEAEALAARETALFEAALIAAPRGAAEAPAAEALEAEALETNLRSAGHG
ncbi:MAG: hypothetical protein AAGM38_05865 [Pseudomonadota bacterium]